MKPEQKFSLWLRSKLPGDVIRIENTIGAGIPDINWCCLPGVETWIETKIETADKCLLRKEQYAWGIRRSQQAGRVFVIMITDSGLIMAWKYPQIMVKPYSGKLMIVSQCYFHCDKKDFHFRLLID